MIAISQTHPKSTAAPAFTTECPTCGGPLEDYRQALANHAALEQDGVCFLWTDNDYTCSNRAARRARRAAQRRRYSQEPTMTPIGNLNDLVAKTGGHK